MYAPVVVPGYRLVLTVKTEVFEYHTDSQASIVYCGSKEK